MLLTEQTTFRKKWGWKIKGIANSLLFKNTLIFKGAGTPLGAIIAYHRVVCQENFYWG
jgi:hypothetical protein